VHTLVDENLPPSHLSCRCGARFPLFIEEEEQRDLPDLNSGAKGGSLTDVMAGKGVMSVS